MPLQLTDYGHTVTITAVENGAAKDISAATAMVMLFRLPNGSTTERTASFVTSGADGQFRCTIPSDFLTVAGVWSVQGKLTFASAQYHTEPKTFSVKDNLA